MKRFVASAIMGAVASTGAMAQERAPEFAQCRTIRMIVPYPTGGGGDVGARLLAPELSKAVGVPIMVDNVPGAGSQLGITQLARSKPDGCTIGWTHLPAAITLYLDKQRQAVFDRSSFAPIAMYVIDGGGIAVKPDAPYATLQEIADASRANPGAINVSDSGVLSDGHILLERFNELSNGKLKIVHGAGGGEGLADLLGGHVQGMTINLGGATFDLVRSGRIKLLGVFTDGPVAAYPDVKTAKAQGFDMTSATSRALSFPAGVPQAAVDRMSAAVKASMNSKELMEKAAKLSLSLHYLNAAETAKYWADMEAETKPLVDALSKAK